MFSIKYSRSVRQAFFANHLSTTSGGVRSLSSYLIGCYKGKGEGEIALTEDGNKLNEELNGKLLQNAKISNFKGDVEKTRTFFNLSENYPVVTLSGLGEKDMNENPNECRDEKKENIRIATGAGVKAMKEFKVDNVYIDPCGDARAAAEGSNLALYKYDELKSKKQDHIDIALLEGAQQTNGWDEGIVLTDAQNFTRDLTERPSNFKYPQRFAELVENRFASNGAVEMIIRDEDWAKEKGMGSFLCVGQGSKNPSRFLELHYKGSGGDTAPIVLVGKGVTFDTGGISIKPSKAMGNMRNDMGGAATVVGAIDAISRLNISANVIGLIPLSENMPSDRAVKPGDVVTAMNGKTIEVDNTDAEGRLILADALCYADEFKPSTVIDLATLTGAVITALGSSTAGAYVICNELWKHLDQASQATGDRLWRLPIYEDYTKDMKWSMTADLMNINKTSGAAGSPTAAAFLKEFVTVESWAHLDIAAVVGPFAGGSAYQEAGMTGRPMRTLVEAVRSLSQLK